MCHHCWASSWGSHHKPQTQLVHTWCHKHSAKTCTSPLSSSHFNEWHHLPTGCSTMKPGNLPWPFPYTVYIQSPALLCCPGKLRLCLGSGLFSLESWICHFTAASPCRNYLNSLRASLWAQLVKNPSAMQETKVWLPGSGRSSTGGNGNLLQYSRLEILLDRGAWWAIVKGVTKESDTT